MAMANGATDVGVCPECGSIDCECCHETLNGEELWVWAECGSCGHQFIEVFKRDRVERWEDFR